ncbi:MAG: orotidine-5'-phosphate decarboxylase [Lentisphaeria bacterium]|nr:orotidine-5'-phosphate decarboxylase [Lentisphaeria bacterium]
MRTKLIVALDVNTLTEAEKLVDSIGPDVEWFKVGKQLFTRYGPAAVDMLKARGKNVFLDLKFHDIPNTVAQAVRSAASLGADMTNVHAAGGPAMLKAAAAAASESDILLIAVTVLTSMNADELAATGITDTPETHVIRLAKLTQASGLAGVVCSALEITPIKAACGEAFTLVVPGIRPAGSAKGDQKRVMTPGEASRAGADFIVVGRPITQAEVPSQAAAAVLAELRDVTQWRREP